MTEEARTRFLLRFAEKYDLPAAAAGAGITRQEAYRILRDPAARAMVDERAAARHSSGMQERIVREYERIAFGEDGDSRAGDRMRAMEQLRMLAETPEQSSPGLTIVCEYV